MNNGPQNFDVYDAEPEGFDVPSDHRIWRAVLRDATLEGRLPPAVIKRLAKVRGVTPADLTGGDL